VHAIRRLQHAYGYYLDKCLYDDVVELFTDELHRALHWAASSGG